MARMWRGQNLEALISQGNVQQINQLPAVSNVNQQNNNYPILKEQIQRLESLLNQEITKIYQLQTSQKGEWIKVEVERQKKQEEWESKLTKELQVGWQNVVLGVEEQLQLQKSVFMQEISAIRSELAVLRDDKEQRESEETAVDNAEQNVVEEVLGG